MLDIGIPDIINDWRRTGKLQRWLSLLASCLIGAFIGFWGTLGLVGSAMLASNHSPIVSLVSGFFSACLIMAGSVLLSVQKSGLYKDLSIVLPKELEKVLESSDVVAKQ